jgi:hypothetical protein
MRWDFVIYNRIIGLHVLAIIKHFLFIYIRILFVKNYLTAHCQINKKKLTGVWHCLRVWNYKQCWKWIMKRMFKTVLLIINHVLNAITPTPPLQTEPPYAKWIIEQSKILKYYTHKKKIYKSLKIFQRSSSILGALSCSL